LRFGPEEQSPKISPLKASAWICGALIIAVALVVKPMIGFALFAVIFIVGIAEIAMKPAEYRQATIQKISEYEQKPLTRYLRLTKWGLFTVVATKVIIENFI